ncbi:MAG: ROK family protein [Bdellovibrionales bacterium]|nr:ROK family protein [Bdellovibrionales bacterium]
MDYSPYILGLDIGGTKVESVLGRLSIQSSSKALPLGNGTLYFEELDRRRIPTERHLGYELVVEKVSEMIRSQLRDISVSLRELPVIGVGLPGTVDPKTQIMLNGNSQIFIDKNFVQDLKKELSWSGSIYINNDANCFAFAELVAGCGSAYKAEFNVSTDEQVGIGIILGTGCGGGLVINREIFSGQGGGGMEIGHSVLVHNGRECYCGRKGCAEQYLSGSGLTLSHPQKLSGPEIFRLAEQGHQECLNILKQYKELLVEFITNLSNIFDPHWVVLGGGLSNQDFLYQELENQVAQKTFLPNTSPRIYKNTLGDSAGVYGAIFWANRCCQKESR